MTTGKLHRDVLPEVNVLTRHLDDIEAAEDVGGHHSHLSPGEANYKTMRSAKGTGHGSWDYVSSTHLMPMQECFPPEKG